MRLAFAVGALSLSLLGIAGQLSPPAESAASVSTTPSASPASTDSASAALGSDAAAKHVKRTACLKDAKTKKLVGAEKTSFLKTCIAAP